MRISLGILASAAVLFLFGALGLLGSWAVVFGTLVGLVGGVALVIALEDRERAGAGMAAFVQHR